MLDTILLGITSGIGLFLIVLYASAALNLGGSTSWWPVVLAFLTLLLVVTCTVVELTP